VARKLEGSKPRDGYIQEYVRDHSGIAFSRRNKFQIIEDPSNTFPEGGFFGRYDFLMSLSGEVWPEGLIVRDYRGGEASDKLMVHYKDAEREGAVDKFLVSTETGWTWKLNDTGGYKLVKHSQMGEHDEG